MNEIVIIGAGAAGLMAAIAAGSSGSSPVRVLERTPDGGRKILISGGGRCNVLPSSLDPGDFVTASSPNSLRRLLLDWPLAEQREFFEHDLGIPLQLEAETGKLFPVSNRARDVRDALTGRARGVGVHFRFGTKVLDVRPSEDAGARWEVILSDKSPIPAHSVIFASGGLSVPATGSDGTGLTILERLGHSVHDLYPALTPLLCSPPRHSALAGVSLDVTLEATGSGAGRTSARGGFLFTHRGYSGPVVLDLSHHAVLARRAGDRCSLRVRWTHESEEVWDRRLRQGGGTRVRTPLRDTLPDRLADRLLEEAGVAPDTSLSQLPRTSRLELASLLGAYPLPWTGDEGYRKAEVTGGGVDLQEVNPRTLESRLHPGLFLCGELLDAFGPIGGYNFAWSWSTGRRAGLGAASAA